MPPRRCYSAGFVIRAKALVFARHAARSLGKVAGRAEVEALVAVLQDGSEAAGVRCGAAGGLVFHPVLCTIEPMLAVVADPHEPPCVRAAVAESLGKMGDTRRSSH